MLTVEMMEPHRCESCGRRFSDGALLASHHCSHRQAAPSRKGQLKNFKCSQCSKVFSKPAALKRHFKLCHRSLDQEGPFSCREDGCQFSSADHREHQSHLTSTHGLTLVPCTFQSCRGWFLTRGEMENHRRAHMPFGCFHCQFVAQNAKDLSEHLSEHSNYTQGSETEPMTASTDGSHQSQVSSWPKRKRKPHPASPSSPKDREEEGLNGKRARKAAAKNKDTAVDAVLLPSKDYLAEGAEHIYRTHTCPKCRRCFKMRSHLQEHLHLHFPDPSLQCPTCQRYFTSKSKLRIHRLREAGEKVHHCHLCQYSAVERNAIRRHMVTMHADEAEDGTNGYSYLCPRCGKSFRQSRSLKIHMKTHNMAPDSEPVACFLDGCSFQSSIRKELLRHAAKVHGVKAVECRHHACGAIFPDEKDMEAHYRTHLAYHCSHCSFFCSNKTVFLQHQRHGHPGSDELRCDFCTFITFNPVEFEQHIGHLHANEKIHRCSQCSYVTSHKRGLKRHMLMHSGEKPHKCSLCEFRCRDESYLSKHMLTHSDDKNFMCAECGYVTKWKHYLNVHMRKHAGDLRYQCDQCPYRCHRRDQLNSHKLRHQAKSLMCEICAYACKRKYELHNHMLTKHSGEGKQLSVHKCKYCTYTTCYRQALQNHENCKHTKLKEFRCALCFYSSFSSISLFLHKRKAHGYVPGDQDWLQKYAVKEKERNSAGFMQDFYNKPLIGNEPSEQVTEERPTEQPDVPSTTENTSQGPDAAAALQAAGSVNEVTSGIPLSGNSPEYCTLVLTTLSTTEYENTTLQNEEESSPSTSTLMYHKEDFSITRKEEEEDDDESDFDDSQNDTNQPGESEQCPAETPEVENDRLISNFPPEENLPDFEIRLKAMKKHDKDQADAMVLEGRVQMLVVPTKDMYRCDNCSYVTTKETALKYHCRSLCHARTRGHECQACGAHFKQRRGLVSHLAKKCPALPRKKRTFTGIADLSQEDGSKQLDIGVAADSREEEVLVHGASTSSQSEHDTGRVELASAHLFSNKQVNVSLQKKMLYTEEDGKFKCRLCSFSSVKLATINRHISNCQKTLSEVDESIKERQDKVEEPSVGPVEVAQRPQIFSCPSCEFKCNQRRALDRHERSGCLKPGEVHCTMCSFVAKSNTSLTRHILQVHDEHKFAKQKCLNCENCSFICKQERSMAQHVALKHKGLRPHSCRYCPFSTTRRYRLEEHESLHTGVGRHHCDMCNKTFGAVTKLRQHKMRIHDRQPTHECSLCDFSGYTLDDVRRHKVRCHTGELHHACAHCEARFSSDAALRNHCNRAHQLLGSLSCQQCEYTCGSEVTLKSHQQSKHPQLRCPTCQETFETKESLEFHQRTHLAHQCQLCPFAAKTKQLLAQHLLNEHEDGPPLDKPLKCSSCPFACQHQLVLEQHLRSHGGSRLYKCTDCKYSTRNKQKITWHIRIHTGEKPYSCEQCSYACSDPSRLKLHMRVHQEEKKYLCPECGYKCKWASQLKYHMTKHTGEKPHACDECDYRTNRADALRAHRDTQHCDVRPFICEKCGKAFKTSFILKTHQRQHSDDRPYACGLCQKAFRWPAGLRHHYLSHTKRQPFRCRHCTYRAKQKFQVVKHLQRHHPEMEVEQGVVRDSDAVSLTLKEALQGLLDERAAEEEDA
ncbi:zinc finger protein 142 [Aulostomus maculatus]